MKDLMRTNCYDISDNIIIVGRGLTKMQAKFLKALIMLYFFVKFFKKVLRKFVVSVIIILEVYQ